MKWAEEVVEIITACNKVGVDPYFVAAIRKTENGGPGREFGVLSVETKDYYDQLRIACASVKNAIVRFGNISPLAEVSIFDGKTRLGYSAAFIEMFAENGQE